MKWLASGLAVIGILLAGSIPALAEIRVARDGESLGTLTPFAYSGSAADAYGYVDDGEHYTGFPPLERSDLALKRSHLFFVNASDGLSLFVVHDNTNLEPGNAHMVVSLAGDPNDAAFLVQDDPYPNQWDTYSPQQIGTSATEFTAEQTWERALTDGFVIGPLDGDWKINARFVDVLNLGSWYAYGQAGEQINLTPYMVGLTEVTFEIPEPSSLVCMAGLFAMAFFVSWWRRWNKAS